MKYTITETKAIQQVSAKFAKYPFGFWCCDGLDLFSITPVYSAAAAGASLLKSLMTL